MLNFSSFFANLAKSDRFSKLRQIRIQINELESRTVLSASKLSNVVLDESIQAVVATSSNGQTLQSNSGGDQFQSGHPGVDAAAPGARTLYWTGFGLNNNWSNPLNWRGIAVPTNGDNLVFPNGANQSGNYNDLTPGTLFHDITFEGDGYNVGGNAISLDGSINLTSGQDTRIDFFPDIDLKNTLNSNVTVGAKLDLVGTISGNYGVEKVGDGQLLFLKEANRAGKNNSYTGLTWIKQGGFYGGRDDGNVLFLGDLKLGDKTSFGTAIFFDSDHVPDTSNILLGGEYPGSKLTIVNHEKINDLIMNGSDVFIRQDARLAIGGRIVSGIDAAGYSSSIDGEGVLDLANNNNFSIDVADDPSNYYDISINAEIENGGIVKTGEGIVEVGWANRFDGDVVIKSGALEAYDSQALGTTVGKTIVESGASLIVWGENVDFPEEIVLSGSGKDGKGALQGDDVSPTVTGKITLVGDSTIGAIDGAVLTIAGALEESVRPANLTIKNDADSKTIIRNNAAYTGETQVVAGALIVNGSIASSSKVIVDTNATIGGSGTLPEISLAVDSTLEPGDGDKLTETGILGAGNTTFASGAKFNVQINGNTAGDDYDQLNVTGSVQLNNAILNLAAGDSLSSSQPYVIVNNDGTDAVVGTFANTPDNAIITAGKNSFRVKYHGGDGNDVALVRFANSTTFLTVDQTIAEYGSLVTLSAKVQFDSGSPTGVVEFMDGAELLGSAKIDSNGIAKLTVSSLSLGMHQVVAKFALQGNAFGSLSSDQSIEITKASTQIALSLATPNANPSIYGDKISIQAVVSAVNSTLGIPAGKISFEVDHQPAGTFDVDSNGVATLTTSLLTASATPHYIQAIFESSDPIFNNTITVNPLEQTVQQASLKVKANDVSRAYGKLNPTFTFSYDGFKNGEALGTSDITGAPVASTSAVQGSPLAGNPYAINVASGSLKSNNYKFDLVKGSLTLTPEIVQRPVIDTLPPMVEDVLPNSSTEIVGSPVSKLTANISDVNYQSVIGIAITVAPSSPTTGGWEYSVNGGKDWKPITGVSDTHALLLTGADANRVRFVPAEKFTGFVRLGYVAWNGKTDSPTTSASVSFGNTHAGVVSDPNIFAAPGTGYSLATELAVVAVGNTSPLIDINGNTLLTHVAKNNTSPRGDTIGAILGTLVDNPNAAKLGIAITSLDSTHGKWQYQIASSSSKAMDAPLRDLLGKSENLADASGNWITISGVSDNAALLLASTDKIRFVPGTDFVGQANLKFHAWDRSIGQSGDIAKLPSSAFSDSVQSAIVNVVNKPKLETSTSHYLTDTAPSVIVGQLLLNHVGDVAPTDRLGIAVTDTIGNGVWSYRIGAGKSIVLNPAPNSAILLPANAILEYKPRAGSYGSAALSYHVWNATLLPAIVGSSIKMEGPAFSDELDVVSMDLAPKSGFATPTIGRQTITLPSQAEDKLSQNSVTVYSISNAIRMSGVRRNIVVIEADNSHGQWQFSADGNPWKNFGTPDLQHGLALEKWSKIRFVPNAEFSGATSFKFKAWNGINGSSGDIIDSTSESGIGSTVVTATLNIKSVNDSPVLDSSAALYLPGIASGETSATIDGTKLLAKASDTETPVGSLGLKVIAQNGPGSWQYSLDGVKFERLVGVNQYFPQTVTFRFVGAVSKIGVASLSYQAWDQSSKKVTSLSANTQRLTVAVGNSAPNLTGLGKLTSITRTIDVNPGDSIDSLLGKTFVDTKNSLRGIALAGVNSQGIGEWQTSLNNGKTWEAVKDVSAKSALLLPETARIRFVPTTDRTIDSGNTTSSPKPTISYKAWDQTVGEAGQKIDTTAVGLNSFSMQTVVSDINVDGLTSQVNLDNRLLQSFEARTGESINHLLQGAVISQTSSKFGIAIVGLSGVGDWVYSNDNFATPGIKISGVSNANALLLSDTASIRFIPNASFKGIATLSYKAWDITNSKLKGTVNLDTTNQLQYFSPSVELLQVNVGNTAPVLNRL